MVPLASGRMGWSIPSTIPTGPGFDNSHFRRIVNGPWDGAAVSGIIPAVRIIACTIWYDESPDDLAAMARSLHGFADGMVALDGAFETFPLGDNRPWSPSEQYAALADGCAGEIELVLYQPTRAGEWFGHRGNEVEKRNASVRMAWGVLGADWVFNVDADMFLEEAGDARRQMELTDEDVVISDVEGHPTRHIYRYSPGLRHYRSHWIVLNERGMLSGPRDPNRGIGDYPPLLPGLDLRETLLFAHPEKRDYWRRVRQKAWYEIRDGTKLEAW